MPENPNKLSRFWNELKRRKVLRVVTVYAAAAFVILQLVEILAPSLRLPEWTMNFILVLLIVGFVIAVILSWIYDIHPEGGIVKTEPALEVKEEEIPKSSSGWKIASIISFVVIVGLVILNILPRQNSSGHKAVLEKSIAVLPFHNDSPDKENEYFISGTMESILNNLSKIEDLRVISRSSVEQYRDTFVNIPEVANEKMVSYVLEGSMQKYGNHIRLTLQLIDRNDNHVWSEQYDREITKVEEHLALQSEIAKLVAKELEAVITPEETQLIDKIPTTNLTAFDYYTQGRERLWEYVYENNVLSLDKAEYLLNSALEYDSTYAEAYIGLSWVYWNKNYYKELLSERFLDSVLILVEKALYYDNELSEAYVSLGNYYRVLGEIQLADEAFNQAINLNPNDWMAYRLKGLMYTNYDLVESMKNRLIAAAQNRGPELPGLLRGIGASFSNAGYYKKGLEYFHQALDLDGDSVAFLWALGFTETDHRNNEKAIRHHLQILKLDSTQIEAYSTLGYLYSFSGQFEESVAFYKQWLSGRSGLDDPEHQNMLRIGYAFYSIGELEMANEYFDKQLENCRISIELDRWDAKELWDYYNQAAVYAFRGDRESAYQNLRIFSQRKMMPLWMVVLINDDPLFESIRDEPEFQQIVRNVEAKYQAERERVRQWLEENDML